MKVAIVITGHMRCWKQLAPHFKEKYINVYNPDIYISTWNTEGWWQWGDYFKQSPLVNADELREFYKPKRLVVEPFDPLFNYLFTEKATKYTNAIGHPKNMISMFYKWMSGINLLEDQYDLVIRMRPDVQYLNHLPDFDPSNFYVAEIPGLKQGGLGDMFHAGNQADMSSFCSIFDYLDPLYQQTDSFCTHLLSQQHAKNLNLKLIEFINEYILHNTPFGSHQDVLKFL